MSLVYIFKFAEEVDDRDVDFLIEDSFGAAIQEFGNKNDDLKSTWSVSDGLATLTVTNSIVGHYIFKECVKRFDMKWGRDKFTVRRVGGQGL